MAMSAFAKAGAPLVERYDTSVSELELKYANNKLISRQSRSQGRRARPLPTDPRRPGAGLGLLRRRRHHRAELQHPVTTASTSTRRQLNTSRLHRARIGGSDLCHERRPRPAPDQHPHARSGGRDLLPEADRRPPGPAPASSRSGTTTPSTSPPAKAASSPCSWACASLIERATVEMMANLYGMPGPRSCMQYRPARRRGHHRRHRRLCAGLQQPENQQCGDPSGSVALGRQPRPGAGQPAHPLLVALDLNEAPAAPRPPAAWRPGVAGQRAGHAALARRPRPRTIRTLERSIQSSG